MFEVLVPAGGFTALRLDVLDFEEMLIQFGFANMFAVAMPVAMFFALINNIVEIRGDALALTVGYQRPRCRQAKDIGAWMPMLSAVSLLAVLTNALLVGFVGTVLSSMLHGPRDLQQASYENELQHMDVRYHRATHVWAFLFMEHGVLLLKLVLAVIIPDVPEEVVAQRSELDWFIRAHESKSNEATES